MKPSKNRSSDAADFHKTGFTRKQTETMYQFKKRTDANISSIKISKLSVNKAACLVPQWSSQQSICQYLGEGDETTRSSRTRNLTAFLNLEKETQKVWQLTNVPIDYSRQVGKAALQTEDLLVTRKSAANIFVKCTRPRVL